MPEVGEKKTSGTLSGGVTTSYTVVYWADGYATSAEARAAVLAEIDETYEGLPITDFEVRPDPERDYFYEVEFVYGGSTTGGADDGVEEGFDTSGGTMHIDRSRETRLKVSHTGGEAPDFGGLINVDQDNINGTDIIVPAFEFTRTKQFSDSEMTTAFKKQIADLTGTINDDTFDGFPAGEVLFAGATGSRRGPGQPWQVTFRFLRKPNISELDFGPDDYRIELDDVYGWDVVWARYNKIRRESGGVVVLSPVPIAAYVERVYDFADFGLLQSD